MKKIIFIVLIMIVPGSGMAFDLTDSIKSNVKTWDFQDTVLQITLGCLVFVDLKQTIWVSQNPVIFVNNPNGSSNYVYHTETNPIIGKNASTEKIVTYFTTCFILHTSVACILPKKYRTIWQSISIGLELNSTISNYYADVKFKF